MKKIRVAHLTSVHPRYDVRIFEKEARSLAHHGYETFLLVGDGHGEEQRSGVHILDVGPSPRGRLLRMVLQPWRILRRAMSLRATVYHFHDPELVPVGLFLRVCGAKVIYDCHEDLPRDILSKPWLSARLRPLLARITELLENFAAAHFSVIVAATPHIAKRFSARNRFSVAVNNYPRREELAVDLTPKNGDRTVCYVGGIGFMRGAAEMIRAAEIANVRLVLAGAFESAGTEEQLRKLPGWSKVDYRGVANRNQVRDIMAESRVGLVLLHPMPNYVDALPTKMFEYMSAGLPVIASDFPLLREILVDSGAGLCVDPLDPRAIAAAIERLLTDPEAASEMGARGRELVAEKYNWGVEEQTLWKTYERMLQ